MGFMVPYKAILAHGLSQTARYIRFTTGPNKRMSSNNKYVREYIIPCSISVV
ncbi:predicted protein [Sclerotinia sclerotiorum 1980 UF-70]|uniref:Uncharacterized protein n=1 Tax=Sclerotinia sclerotiorum (strain ATCC 18683 / 1980 / Ss-1) TaxID=665079 RepID=A7EB81_SCLS1|nr:predicted protein [Sclerotinia sclerotiorum 1980 UF-70]EDN99709.1 predicted protein [Sclerotinia sclerotiorum 1980 UF-70]